jgi:hypothetical protein
MLGVVLTCHPAYLPLLPAAVAGWQAQAAHLMARVVVFDGCVDEVLPDLPEGWEVLHYAAGTPNPGRNLGLLKAASMGAQWVIHWDADNVPPTHYAETALDAIRHASDDVGVMAPLITNAHNPSMVVNLPTGKPSEDFVLDTASVWRVEAVRHAGGWPDPGTALDDWTLCLRLHLSGWVVQPLHRVIVQCSRHALGHRHVETSAARAEAMWIARPMTIIILLAGRMHLLDRLAQALHEQHLPPNCSLVVSLPHEGPCIRDRVMAAFPMAKFRRVTWIQTDGQETLEIPPGTGGAWEVFAAVHRRVGRLYAEALNCTQDPAILMWEDDVIPHQADALYQLNEQLIPHRRIAGVAAVYPSRDAPTRVVASMSNTHWKDMPLLATLTDDVRPVGMIAGGFTLWSREALRQAAPRSCNANASLGWDGDTCRRLAPLGWRLLLHGAVRCAHHTQPLTLTGNHG